MRFPSGQPLWQNGTPHSMQRAPCAWSSASGRRTRNSLKVLSPSIRWAGSSYTTPERWIFRKPPSSPIGAHLAGLGGDPPVAGGVAARAGVRGRDEVRVGLALGRDEASATGALRVVVVRGGRLAGALGLGRRELGEHALVVGREDLDE